MTGLIAMLTQLVESDRREAALLATEKDTQIALDYITEDLREAVFVYENIDNTLTSALPNFSTILETGETIQPIIAFWKTEPVPEDQIPTDCNQTDELLRQECQLLLQKRNVYTQVVYLQVTETTWTNSANNNSPWLGRSRILRYSLPKYSDPQTLAINTGYVDPAVWNNFPTWPLDANGNNQQGARPTLGTNPPLVLTDFIDIPNRTEFRSTSNPNLPPLYPACNNDLYARVPSGATNFNSFFACVRRTNGGLGANQDIIVYLRGNAEGRDRLNKTVDYIPVVQSQVTLRGVIDKFGRN